MAKKKRKKTLLSTLKKRYAKLGRAIKRRVKRK